MLGPAIYQDMIQRVHQNLIRELNINGIKYTTLHICGKLGDEQLKSIADTGATSLDVDAPVDMHHARTVLGKRLAFIGNVGTTDLIIKKPEEIEENCRQLLEPRDLGLVLAAGCTMGPATPKENVAAMVTAARKYGCFS